MTTLETERLLLRQFEAADTDAYAVMMGDPEIMRFLGTGQTLDRMGTWRHIAYIRGHWQLRGYGMFALEEKGGGRLVGHAGIVHPEGWPGLELGWALQKDCWGRGYATEAAREVLRYAFEELGREDVISMMYPENTASMRVAERIGERQRSPTQIYGKDVVVYGITAAEYAAARHG